MSEPSRPPPDQPQESEPPDLDTLLHAVRVYLYDVRARLGDGDDLGLRAGALRAVVVRAIHNRGGDG